MRLSPRRPLSVRSTSLRRTPRLEILEDRTLPAVHPLLGQFQSVGGLLTLHGDSANHTVSVSLSSTGFVQLNIGGQQSSSDPRATDYNPALAGATGQTLKAIQLSGSPGQDQLVLGNLTVSGGLSVASDGVLDVQGQISAAGSIQLSSPAVRLSGQVRADGPNGGGITVTADSVQQSGLLEANGSQGAGGSIRVDFTGSYLATVSSITSANSLGRGTGGVVVIDGHASGTLFSSGQYQASAVHGLQGGEIDLFAQQVQLVGASINASGVERRRLGARRRRLPLGHRQSRRLGNGCQLRQHHHGGRDHHSDGQRAGRGQRRPYRRMVSAEHDLWGNAPSPGRGTS